MRFGRFLVTRELLIDPAYRRAVRMIFDGVLVVDARPLNGDPGVIQYIALGDIFDDLPTEQADPAGIPAQVPTYTFHFRQDPADPETMERIVRRQDDTADIISLYGTKARRPWIRRKKN